MQDGEMVRGIRVEVLGRKETAEADYRVKLWRRPHRNEDDKTFPCTFEGDYGPESFWSLNLNFAPLLNN